MFKFYTLYAKIENFTMPIYNSVLPKKFKFEENDIFCLLKKMALVYFSSAHKYRKTCMHGKKWSNRSCFPATRSIGSFSPLLCTIVMRKLMCNDSVVNIRYDDQYKVWTNFSILHMKNKVYDYTEYRVLNDGIKICNSADNFVRNIWKVRNKWVKARMHRKGCNKPIT